MRNATPSNKAKTSSENEETSGKKLVQARLPFKLLAPGASPSSAAATPAKGKNEALKEKAAATDKRKRKISFEPDSEDEDSAKVGSKENIVDVTTKKKKTEDVVEDDVILLDDSSDEADLKNKQIKDVVASPKTPVMNNDSKLKTKATKSSTSSAGRSNKNSDSGQKLKIKLPLSNSKKNKRRKSMRKSVSKGNSKELENEAAATTESSDDIEMLAGELNPQKRKKIEIESQDTTKKVEPLVVSDDSSINENDEETNAEEETKEMIASTVSNDDPNKLTTPESAVSEEIGTKINKSSSNANEEKNSKDTTLVTDIEADDESEEVADKFTSSPEITLVDDSDVLSSKNDNNKTNPTLKNENTKGLLDSKKNLTPKQLKLLDQRRKAREEKERKLSEERLQKQQEKEEKEMAKKRDREEKEEQRRKEREEKEEQRRKEREEKDEQKRKEREEKEQKRLAEIEAKNEEKRKRNEAKEEEVRKREDERKRKEQEKEEAELKKRKAAEAFTKFFVAKTTNTSGNCDLDQTSNDSHSVSEILAFRPFQIKGDMKMAPLVRKTFTTNAKQILDTFFHLHETDEEETVVRKKPLHKSQLYLAQLKAGKIVPGKWRRPSVEFGEKDDDVVLIEDELERAGQTIEETHPLVERHRAKFYKFHENRRPPYYGTWRKKSSKVIPRRPFAQDQKFFDYEVDSDLEWEEEEPGESLDGSDDDKEKESEDDDYEVDNEWFVPHGHLSDEELQNEDEIGGDGDTTRDAQKAKLKLLQQEFAQEMKKKTEKLKPRLVGCVWVDENGNHPDLCFKIIWDMLDKRAMLYTEPPILYEPTVPEKTEPSSPSTNNAGGGVEKTTEKLKPIAITDNLQKELVRLVHGNTHSKVFLIKEFIAHIEANETTVKNGDVRGPLKSAVREKIEEFAEWKVIDTNAIVKKNKNKTKKKLCWVVTEETLKKMNMENLDIKNEWQYTLPPKRKEAPTDLLNDNEEETEAAAVIVQDSKSTKKGSMEIKNFAKVLTDEEKAEKNLKDLKEPIKTPTTKKSKVKQNTQKPPTPSQMSNSTDAGPTPKKKRVALLMSVARGQQFATPAKNALISQFLKKSSEAREQSTSSCVAQKEDKIDDTITSSEEVILLD